MLKINHNYKKESFSIDTTKSKGSMEVQITNNQFQFPEVANEIQINSQNENSTAQFMRVETNIPLEVRETEVISVENLKSKIT